MKIQIEDAPEPLNHAEEHPDDGSTQLVVPRQLIPQAIGQAQDPLHPSAAAAPGTPACRTGTSGIT